MQDLLNNGGFESDFYAWRGTDELQVAGGWTPWWVPQTGGDPVWKNRRPAYRQATQGSDSGRVRSGKSSQHYFSFWGTHTAGLWQQALVDKGARLQFRAWGHGRSSEVDQPRPSQNPTHVHMSIGMDPLGGTDPTSTSIVWSSDLNAIDDWHLFAVEARAQNNIVTMFVRSAPEWPKKHQDIFWDDASLEVLEPGTRGGSNAGGDRLTELMLVPSAPRPGVETTAVVLSPTNHCHVRLAVRGPDLELLPVSGPSLARQGDRYVWEFRFRPTVAGFYTLVFGSDTGSRIVRWARLSVGTGARASASQPIDSTPAPAVGVATYLASNCGAPRLQYRRTYVLLPPTADPSWAEAAMRGGFDSRRTVGFSADDAGIGDLIDRRVIAVNPHHWPTELTADWFEEHYPRVKFYSLIAETPDKLVRALRNWRD